MTEADARAHLAGDVSRETLAALDGYAELLRTWQRRINLVAPASIPALWSRHILDSFQLFQLRPRSDGHWLDLGSGAGFPGLVCAIVAATQAPDLRFTLIESDGRKAAFLREAARRSHTRVTLITERIEAAKPQQANILTARALAPLERLCDLGHPHLAADGVAMFPKGRSHLDEQSAADRHWTMTRRIVPSLTDPEAVIYIIGDLARA